MTLCRPMPKDDPGQIDHHAHARDSYLRVADTEAYLAMRATLRGETAPGPLWARAEVAVADLWRHVRRTEPVRRMIGSPPEWDAVVGRYMAVWDRITPAPPEPEPATLAAADAATIMLPAVDLAPVDGGRAEPEPGAAP